MDFFSILTLLGGLAMFLYGMQVMGDGLAKVCERSCQWQILCIAYQYTQIYRNCTPVSIRRFL